MDDDRVWSFEQSLWTGDAENYREKIDTECLMVVPTAPHVLQAEDAIEAVADTPRWAKVTFTENRIVRPQEGLIVIAYFARAERQGERVYEAYCTSVYRRLEHEVWRVVQHQQTPKLIVGDAS